MAKASKKSTKKNKLGVKNSLVNNINARKKKGRSRSKKKSTISKENYDAMERHWKKKPAAKKSAAKKRPVKKSAKKKLPAKKK
jgi:hypothetical protein